MEDKLSQIVNPEAIQKEYVDMGLLNAHTSQVSAGAIRWGNVRHLYMIGELDHRSGGIQAGFYADPTKRWVLAAGLSPDDIRKYLARCRSSLEMLCILSSEIVDVALTKLTGLRELTLMDNSRLLEIQGLEQTVHLETLTLEKSRLVQIAFPKVLEHLRVLHLNRNYRLESILYLENLPALEKLHLGFTDIKDLRIGKPLTKLDDFDALYAPLQDDSFLRCFPNLRKLRLQGTAITALTSTQYLKHLRTLVLSMCPISSLDSVALPESLERLYLAETRIRRLPNRIGELKHLQRLDLSGLHLEALPEWLPDLNISMGRSTGFAITLLKTEVDGVDMRIFDQPHDLIVKWFRNRQQKNEKPEPLNELKVVFLGDGGAGKSRTIARLLEDGAQTENFPNISTPGIVIKDKAYTIDNRKIQVHFWDFGGQDILHSMHRMFLTERTLYVVMLNVRDGTQTERARYWLHNIRSFANGAPVLLVLNQIDTNRNASVNQPDLRAMYPRLTEVVAMSALEDDQESVQNNLIAALKRQIGAFDTLESPFLPAWNRLKDQLHSMTKPYIKGDEFSYFCGICGVEDNEQTRMALLRWFSDLGVSFHYGNNFRVRDYVILRPEWITNAVYTIIFNKSDNLKNGLISHKAILELLNPPEEKAHLIRQPIPGMTYEAHEVRYVLDVIRKFRLSFRVGEDTEFIPVLCQADSLPVANEYESDPNTLEFQLQYEYLPNNVLHRLMVDMRLDLDTEQVWLTGALFRQTSSGLSAVVKTEGDMLRIFVRGENDMHHPHTYLNTIRDTLAAIHRDMGLSEPKSLVVYKKDGRTEKFSYKRLTGTLQSGAREIYSEVWDRMIAISDILNQTDQEVERKNKKLLEDIAAACVRMQGNRLLWTASEDDRNTELRDALLNMGYHVSDQSLSGVGASGKRAGELDLLIRNEQNLPWTVCEAMNIKNATASQMDYWDVHLNKLLLNYNSAGMRNLVLISYVPATATNFASYWTDYSNHMRWYNPSEVLRRDGTYQEMSVLPDQFNCLRMASCTYDRGGMPTTVYHFFLRLGL